MTMTVALTHKDLLLVASDTRRTWTYESGRMGYADDAGKLMRVGSGWLTSTGDATLQQKVFAAMNPAADTLEEVGATIAAVREKLANSGAWEVDDYSFFTWTRSGNPATATMFDSRGRIHKGDGKGGDLFFTWPPGLAESDREELTNAFKEAIPRAETLTDLIRLLAALYAIVGKKSSYISDEMVVSAEMPGDGYPAIELLRRPPHWFIRATDQEMMAAAADKPIAAHCAAGAITADKIDVDDLSAINVKFSGEMAGNHISAAEIFVEGDMTYGTDPLNPGLAKGGIRPEADGIDLWSTSEIHILTGDLYLEGGRLFAKFLLGGTLQERQIEVGPPDSGGTGYRSLRILN